MTVAFANHAVIVKHECMPGMGVKSGGTAFSPRPDTSQRRWRFFILKIIAKESRTHTPCGENFSRLSPNLISQDAYLASTRFDKIHQKIQRRRVLCSFARANISQMQKENAKQYKILRVFFLPQVQIFAAQNRVSSALFGYSIQQVFRMPEKNTTKECPWWCLKFRS